MPPIKRLFDVMDRVNKSKSKAKPVLNKAAQARPKHPELSMPGRPKRATIGDVAVLAGVSIKTVSRVFNNEPNVAPRTRSLVQTAISTLGYSPNHSARSLAARESRTLGLLYDNPSPNYIHQIQRGALQSCQELGYDLLLHPCVFGNVAISNEIIDLHRQGRFDGVILTPPLSDMKSVVDALVEARVPLVAIAPAEVRADIVQVITDDERACFAMTRTLFALGHRQIAFIAGHPDHRAVGLRLEGYRSALKEMGLPQNEDYIVQGFNSFESGEVAGAALLSLSQPPSAIFAANDDMAAGVMRVAYKFGISVPGQLSVVGFDDIPLASQMWPALSTVRQPIEAMAARAVKLLVARLRGEQELPIEVLIKSELVLRETTIAL